MNPLRHIGRRHIHLETTDSTNSHAAEFAHDPSLAGTVVTADLQKQGRGQYGRVWESPPGTSILLSALLFPPPNLRRPAILTAFAAVVVTETILELTGIQSQIKWPNDVLLRGKKICGILIECGVAGRARSASEGDDSSLACASGSTERAPHAILGIGLNVNQSAEDFERMGLAHATSLSVVVGQRLNVKETTRRLIGNLDEQYHRLLNGQFEELEAYWTERIGLVGQPVAVELMNATELRGQLTHMTFRELTLLRADGQTLHLLPEEVRHLHAAESTRRQ